MFRMVNIFGIVTDICWHENIPSKQQRKVVMSFTSGCLENDLAHPVFLIYTCAHTLPVLDISLAEIMS